MSKKALNSKLKILIRWGGTGTILSLALAVTYVLYQFNVEERVFTNNYTTSVLFSDSLATSSGAAPWALLSLNWFVCRSMIKRWLGFAKAYFE